MGKSYINYILIKILNFNKNVTLVTVLKTFSVFFMFSLFLDFKWLSAQV